MTNGGVKATMRPARSLLLAPAHRLDALSGSLVDEPDAVLIDIEGIPGVEKSRARASLRDAAEALRNRRVWVRVNAVATEALAADLEALAGVSAVEGLVVPKVRRTDDLQAANRAIDGLEQARALAPGTMPLIVQLDTAAAVFFAHELAACPRVASLSFNGARDGDLLKELGCKWSIDGPELMYSRQYALLAARALGCACPLDGAYVDIEDAAGFARDTALSHRLGYRGRIVLDARQIETANRIYSPSPEEIEYHRKVLKAFEAALAEGKASVTLEGKMIDYAHQATAQAVLAQAKEIGLVP